MPTLLDVQTELLFFAFSFFSMHDIGQKTDNIFGGNKDLKHVYIYGYAHTIQ